jgi:hypothetical protein
MKWGRDGLRSPKKPSTSMEGSHMRTTQQRLAVFHCIVSQRWDYTPV